MGLAAAQALAKAGAAVVIASRSQEKLDTAKKNISGDVQTYRLDFTNEPMVDKFFTKTGKIDHLFEQTGNNLPVKRIGKPEEIAEAVVFLVSNGFVTGTVLDIDGGARLS